MSSALSAASSKGQVFLFAMLCCGVRSRLSPALWDVDLNVDAPPLPLSVCKKASTPPRKQYCTWATFFLCVFLALQKLVVISTVGVQYLSTCANYMCYPAVNQIVRKYLHLSLL